MRGNPKLFIHCNKLLYRHEQGFTLRFALKSIPGFRPQPSQYLQWLTELNHAFIMAVSWNFVRMRNVILYTQSFHKKLSLTSTMYIMKSKCMGTHDCYDFA